MMVSFMPYYKRINLFLVLMLACLVAVAADHQIIIKNADLEASADAYVLNADLEVTLGEAIEEAINKGVPVEFLYEFSLVKPRMLWFDKVVTKANTRITVSYHALSRQYLVNQGERQTSHEILSEAMIELVQLYDWTVFDQSLIEAGESYEAILSMRLDQSKLPKAIQVDAIGSEQWNLAAEPFEWVLEDLKPADPKSDDLESEVLKPDDLELKGSEREDSKP